MTTDDEKLRATLRAQIEESAAARGENVRLQKRVAELEAENRCLREDVEYWGRIGRQVLLAGGFPETDKVEAAIAGRASSAGDSGGSPLRGALAAR